MPVTLLLSALILYFCQFAFGSFKPGYVLILVCLLCSAALIVLKRKDAGFLELYLSNGFWAFIVLGVIFFIADYNRHFSYWDELSHWGKMIKEMMRLDAFYSVPESNLLPHKEYPPLISLFEMLWCQLSGGFSESGSTLALHIFEFSMIVPLLTDRFNPQKGILRKIGIGFAVFFPVFMLETFCDTGNVFSTIYTDYALPLVYAYAVALVLDDEIINSSFGIFSVLVTLFCLVLIRQIGIAFALLIWLLLALRTKKFLLSASALLVPAFSFLFWNRYTSVLGIEGQFDVSKINLGNISAIVFGTSDNLRVEYTAGKYYMRALFDKPVTSGLVNLPFFAASLLCLLGIILLFLYRQNTFKKQDYISLIILSVCGFAGYSILMFVMYLFCFTPEEMLRLACYDRYLGSFVFSEFLLLFILFVNYMLSKKASLKVFIATVAVSLVIFNPSELIHLFPQVLLEGNPNQAYQTLADEIEKQTVPGSRILITSNIGDTFYINYYLENRSVDGSYTLDTVASHTADDYSFWGKYAASIAGSDYYYISNTTDNITNNIGQFTKACDMKPNTLYSIDSDGISFTLKALYTKG